MKLPLEGASEHISKTSCENLPPEASDNISDPTASSLQYCCRGAAGSTRRGTLINGIGPGYPDTNT